MRRYVIVSILAGILFGGMDGLIAANPLAQRLYEVYKPIARASLNAPAGIVMDLVYGFAMAALFLLLYKSLPGAAGWKKGLSFGVLAWFLRVFMAAASQWVMFAISAETVVYILVTGLGEMLVVGLLCGLLLQPSN
jgi:hypothetical protein